MFKKLSEQKNTLKVLLQNRLSSDLQFRYIDVQKAVAWAVKMSKERS